MEVAIVVVNGGLRAGDVGVPPIVVEDVVLDRQARDGVGIKAL